MPPEAAEEFRQINKQILEFISQYEAPREVILNIDDSVMTVFGKQEDTGVGYNPRYHGRASYKEKICTIANTDEIVNVTLENGKTSINNGFIDFYQKCVSMLPKNYVVKRIRVDRGAFDGKNFTQWEEDNIEYVVKGKMYDPIKRAIDYIVSEETIYPFTKIDEIFSVTEATFPLPSWDKARRFVIVRKKIYDEKKELEINAQQSFDSELFKYDYQVIVTNIDYLTPVEIFDEYNQRCDIENNIDEFKEGFAFSENSQQNKKSNELFLLIKMLAYNIHNAFKRFYMPEEVRQREIKTLRRIFYRVSGNLKGNGKYQHISLTPNNLLERIIEYIREQLKTLKPRVVNT